MKCKNCGNDLYQNARFCHKCGKKVEENTVLPFKLNYWTDFVTYAFELSGNRKFQEANFSKGSPADLNWHALRFKEAKGHIEISFNTQKKTLRAGLFILNNPQLYQKLEAQKLYVELLFSDMDVEIQWDGVSKAKNVSVFKKNEDVKTGDRIAQAEWFMECAYLLKKAAINVFE